MPPAENAWLLGKGLNLSGKEFGFRLRVRGKFMKVSFQESCICKVVYGTSTLALAIMKLFNEKKLWSTATDLHW